MPLNVTSPAAARKAEKALKGDLKEVTASEKAPRGESCCAQGVNRSESKRYLQICEIKKGPQSIFTNGALEGTERAAQSACNPCGCLHNTMWVFAPYINEWSAFCLLFWNIYVPLFSPDTGRPLISLSTVSYRKCLSEVSERKGSVSTPARCQAPEYTTCIHTH